jgi:hypothetical protein
MDTDVRRGPRVAALAILVALTGALVQSVELQRVTASQLSAAEVRMRQACRDRLTQAVDKARVDGEVELADWIESLPVYNRDIPADGIAHPAAR